MGMHVLDGKIGTLENPRHREGMDPPTILSYWSSKSMELVIQRLETGHEYATLPLMHTRYLPNVIQPAERREARRPE